MQIPVLIEPLPGKGYRASSGQPLALTAEGPTPEEAMQNLRQAITEQLAKGARLVPLDLPDSEHPLARFEGMLKDDPLFEEWQQTIAELRREKDADPNFP